MRKIAFVLAILPFIVFAQTAPPASITQLLPLLDQQASYARKKLYSQEIQTLEKIIDIWSSTIAP